MSLNLRFVSACGSAALARALIAFLSDRSAGWDWRKTQPLADARGSDCRVRNPWRANGSLERQSWCAKKVGAASVLRPELHPGAGIAAQASTVLGLFERRLLHWAAFGTRGTAHG